MNKLKEDPRGEFVTANAQYPTDWGLDDVHLVHVVRQYDPMVGGLEDFVKNLVRQQRGRFASVKVITLDRLFTDPDRKLPAEDTVEGVPVIRVPFSGSKRYPIAPAVFSKIRDADLVNVHAVDFFFDALALGSVFQRIPLVATTHGGFFHTGKYATLKKVWFNTLTRVTSNMYRGIACDGESDLQMFAKVAPHKVRLVENGVDLDKFADTAARTPQKHIVSIGRFSNNKRPDALIDMMASLCERDPAWKLSVMGGESDWTAAALRQRAAERNLTDNVEICVGLSNSEIRSRLAEASVFASASDYEGFGLSMIEAMSAGLVPVVHPNTSFQSLARYHPLVRLADFSEPDLAAEAVLGSWQQLIQAPSEARSGVMKSAARHSWPEAADRYAEFYRDVLGRG